VNAEALIVDAVRLPRAKAKPDGCYAALRPVELLEPLYRALASRNQLDSAQVDDVLLGCSSPCFDQGANLAKISSLYAGWSERVSGATISRFCCSGLDAVNLAASKLTAGIESVVVAGGVEQLSRVSMFADRGAWYSDAEVMERTRFMHMGLAADLIASQENYSRVTLDQYAWRSHQRAGQALTQGYFERSMVSPRDALGAPLLRQDNAVRAETSLGQLSQLAPSFAAQLAQGQQRVAQSYPGTQLQALHTAGHAPALVDGASLVLLASAQACREQGWTPRAKIQHFANASDEPVRMLTGHLRATEKLLAATGLRAEDIDLWEVNESFAASVLLYQRHFSVASERLNVNGGAIALGHPLGATGGILVATLLDEMERRDLTLGIVAICGGAGVGVASLISRAL
jgi:acetyl-CoA C-acetyltransferase